MLNKLFKRQHHQTKHPPVKMFVCNPGAVFHYNKLKLLGLGKVIIPVGTAVMVFPFALSKPERCEVLYDGRAGWMLRSFLAIEKPPVVVPPVVVPVVDPVPPDEITFD